ncbi:MAG: class I SAM-dependent methyltransferase [Burkholderiales bacterium]|nr:class I SAM-dependent methyltransferase [Burkholderiales bacterium]
MDDFGLQRCRSCAHVYVAPPVPDHVLEEAYEEGYYRATDTGDASRGAVGYEDYLQNAQLRIRGFDQRLSELERFVSPPGRVLDFGCAVGLFVRAAQDRGWRAVGYDRSQWAARYGRDMLGVTIECGALPKFEDSSFDLVTLWDCIEHLPNPRAVLAQARQWLRPGGWLALNTVNSSSLGARLAGRAWRHIAPPFHLHLFSTASLRALLTQEGFAVAHAQCEGVVLRAEKDSDHAGGIRAVADDLLCHWRLRPLATALNLRDEQCLVAQRRS